MSMLEVALPTPPSGSQSKRSMSGLFARSIGGVNFTSISDGLSDPVTSDTECVTRKKVDFHPFAQNILEAPQLSTPDSEGAPSLRSLPPSRDCQPSSRPILKQTQSLESVMGLRKLNERAVTSMDSLLRNLACDDRPSLIDAYQSISNLMKMYDEPPEPETLREKIAHLQSYIRRDLVALDVNPDALPSEERLSTGNLVMSALKVTVTLVWSPLYASHVTDDFRTWIVERSISVLKEHTAPKATLLHYMHLLATQTFQPPTIVHNNRCRRILEAVDELSNHVSGKAVLAERLLVYQKLIEQAKAAMKSRLDLWLKHVLAALGHNFKEVREGAIQTASKACSAFAGTTSTASAARAALAEVANDRTLSSVIASRLERILAAKEDASQIPQIWTFVLMLCNGGDKKLDSWSQLHDWLKIIQRCFNCSDASVRVQSFIAWNRLYYVAKPIEASDKIVSMLAKPAMVQLERAGNSSTSGKGTRQAVVSSYCMLLYYAFRPSANHAQYTHMWNEFVVKLMTRSFLSKSSANCDLSCRVLSALFNSTTHTTRVWNENRAHENAPLDPLELPAIDCKWVRAKMSAILSILRLLVDYASFGLDGKLSEQAYVAQAWRNLIRALKESISKEIKASTDTKAAFSSLFAFVALPPDMHEVNKLERLNLLAKIMVSELGPTKVLQAMEYSDEKCNMVVLQQLMICFTKPEESLEQQPDQSPNLHRCLDLLCSEMKQLNSEVSAETTVSDQRIRLSIASLMLQMAPKSIASQIVVKFQPVLTTLMKRLQQDGINPRDVQDDQRGSTGLCSAIKNLAGLLDAAELRSLDAALSTLLLACPQSLQQAAVDEWSISSQVQDGITLGPELRSIAAQLNSCARQQPADVGSKAVSDVQPSIADPHVAHQPKEASKTTHEAPSKPGSIPTRQRLRYDDSQVQFVAIDSSPPDYAEIESQFLTARQKEVRARQQGQTVLAFADICSSPSVGKRQGRPTDTARKVEQTPEIPETPSVSQQRPDDLEQPPTPTPKARRSLQPNLQPDVPSSPPSVIDGEVHAARSADVMSPLKETTSGEDDIQLDEIEDQIMVEVGERPGKTTGPNIQALQASNTHAEEHVARHVSGRGPSPELLPEVVSKTPNKGQNYTAAVEMSSPTSFSDEYDAMAASQLSQNLVDEGQAALEPSENLQVPDKSVRKRKSTGDLSVNNTRKKRRRSPASVEDGSPVIEQLAGPADEDVGDCIVVNVDAAFPRSASKGKAGRKAKPQGSQRSQSPALSQSPQRSTSSTPTSSQRRKRASKRKTRSSQPSHEPSPQAHMHFDDIHQMPVHKQSNAILGVEMLQDRNMLPNVPPKDIESSELNQPEIRWELPGQILPNSNAGEANTEQNRQESPILEEAVQPAQQVAMTDQATSTEFDLVRTLKSALDHLNNNETAVRGSHLDLATIHSLCFKIGLRAQELAMKGEDSG